MAGVVDILEKVCELPALPSSALRIVSMLTDDEQNLKEVAEIVRQDEAMAMTVLRRANSARYGRSGRVFSLEESIVRLGTRMLMRVAMEQNAMGLFAEGGSSYGLRRGALWRGAMGGALAAEEIAKRRSYPEADLCFLCGLLRDVGKLVLDAYVIAEHGGVMQVEVQHGHTFLEAEQALFSADHTEIGAELARRWRLPQRIINAIRFHHAPPFEEPDHDLLYSIVHASDVICLWAGLAIGYDGLQYELCPHVRDELFVNRDQAEQLMTLTWSRLTELEADMGDACLQGRSA